jgi:hypothetical protein
MYVRHGAVLYDLRDSGLHLIGEVTADDFSYPPTGP